MRLDAAYDPCDYGDGISYGDGETFGAGDGDGRGGSHCNDSGLPTWFLVYGDSSGGNGDGNGDDAETSALFNPSPGNFTAEVIYANVFGARS